MRRLVSLILLAAVFLGGYYVGRLPNSPDIFAWAANTYQRVDQASREIATKAEEGDKSLPEAALEYALNSPASPALPDSQ